MKKIVIVTPYFAPAWAYGGPPKVLYNLAESLIQKKYHVKVITTDAKDSNRNPQLFEEKTGVKIYRFRNISNALAYKSKLFIIPRLLSKTKHILDPADLVLFSDLRTFINWQLFPYLVTKKIPYGVFAYGQIPYDKGMKAIVKRIFDKLWVKDFIAKASYRFAQTEHEREMYSQFFDIPLNRIMLLPLPIKTFGNNINNQKLADFRKKYHIKTTDKVLLFVGRLNYLKGIDLLIKAVIPLLRKNNQLKLMVVGRDDGIEADLKSLVPNDLVEKVIFTGPLYNDDALSAYKSSTCFVFTPRYYEETSVAALDALSYGIPVIVTRQSDIPGLEKYGAGLVIKNTSDTIQEGVISLLGRVERGPDKIKKQCLSLIEDIYKSDKVTDKLLGYIQT